jgi:hypothetical protein
VSEAPSAVRKLGFYEIVNFLKPEFVEILLKEGKALKHKGFRSSEAHNIFLESEKAGEKAGDKTEKQTGKPTASGNTEDSRAHSDDKHHGSRSQQKSSSGSKALKYISRIDSESSPNLLPIILGFNLT